MNNQILNNSSLFNGLNLNPIPLEFSQSMTTTKWLLGMDKKLSSIIDKVNIWYDTLINDIDNNGLLYQHIINHIDSEFINEINNIQLELSTFSAQLIQLIDTIQIVSNVKPKVEISVSPNQSIYNVGESINSVVINYNLTIGSENISKVEVYKNNVLLSTITQNIINGINTFVDGNIITSDTEYKVIVYDKFNTITSNSIKYYFVSNYFHGVINDNTIITDLVIKSLTTFKGLKQNLKNEFNCNNQKILFTYPANYGDLLEIKYNSINFLESFDKTVVLVDNVNYNVYISKNLLNDIFNIEFNISFDEEIEINTTNNNIDGGTF